MSHDLLFAVHEKELADFWRQRAQSLARLQNNQKMILHDCLIIGHEGHDLLLKLFDWHREQWEQIQIEKLSQLGITQEIERQQFIHFETKRAVFSRDNLHKQ